MVVVYDHTVQEHHFVSSGTLMASTCDLKGTKIGETAQCGHSPHSKFQFSIHKLRFTQHDATVLAQDSLTPIAGYLI